MDIAVWDTDPTLPAPRITYSAGSASTDTYLSRLSPNPSTPASNLAASASAPASASPTPPLKQQLEAGPLSATGLLTKPLSC